MLSAGGFDWTGTATPWWVAPGVALLAVWLTARATSHQGTRTERRRAAVEHRMTVLQGFEIDPTGPYRSFTPDDQDLELALIDLGFTRYQATDLTRRLYDHRRHEAAHTFPRLMELSLKEMMVWAVQSSEFRNLQDVLGNYMSGEYSLFRTRRALFGYMGNGRSERRARR
jgi:hypothetical protein